MRLATKIYVSIIGVLVLAVLSSGVALLSTYRIGSLMQSMVAENLASVKAAEELEIALLEQRGFVSSYMLDAGNPAWLEELNRRVPAFSQWLARARETAHTPEERDLVRRIEEVYQKYRTKRGEVVALYEKGSVEEAKTVLLRDMNALYNKVYGLCEEFIATNERFIASRIADGRRQIGQNTLMVGACVSLTVLLSLGLIGFFYRGVLRPLRRMAEDARLFSVDAPPNVPGFSQDELRAVGFYLRTLMSDVRETRSSLERSRNQLMQAEKLASVGKLAASVAHEIRNPLTSLKMRLFSIRRAIGFMPEYEDDFRVMSEEITRLEGVIRNFLEFSRPPDLKLQKHDVSALIDKALELFRHRIEEKDIHLTRQDGSNLPQVLADSDQMKQVFINLLGNAAEAVEEGGEIRAFTALESDRDRRQMVVVRFQDNGPGIAEDIRDRIFEPFFSTKEGGTGLGLCIAARIVARHGGRLELEVPTGHGATFAVRIPAAQAEDDEQDTRG